MGETAWRQNWGLETLPNDSSPLPPSEHAPSDDIARLKKQISSLQSQLEHQTDELLSLRATTRSLTTTITSLQTSLTTLTTQLSHHAPLLAIARAVRLRYLEKHRQRTRQHLSPLSYSRIKAGDRAAHRGRPVVDAILCAEGEIEKGGEVFRELYGVPLEKMEAWGGVGEMVEVLGFRGSLVSEGRLTEEFEGLLGRLVEETEGVKGERGLKRGFEEGVLGALQGQLQDCYDRIVAESKR